MFHRHGHKDDSHGGQPASGSGRQWEKIIGNVVDKRLLPAKYPPHPKIFVVPRHLPELRGGGQPGERGDGAGTALRILPAAPARTAASPAVTGAAPPSQARLR
jgi:hypothetical protein